MKITRPATRVIFFRFVPILTVLLLDFIFLAMLDSTLVNKKRSLIVIEGKEKFEELFRMMEPLSITLKSLRNRYVDDQKYIQEAAEYLQRRAPEVIHEPTHPFFRLELRNDDNAIVYEVENQEKFHALNNWNNSLFSRSFSAPARENSLHITLYYATPQGWDVIEEMVVRYRIYALLFVAATWAIYGLLYRFVFRPLERIGGAMESMIHSSKISLIPRPGQDLEFLFNQMAHNQREVLFGQEIDRLVDRLHSLADHQQVLEQFLTHLTERIRRIYSFQDIEVFLYLPDQKKFHALSPNRGNSYPGESPVEIGENRFWIWFESGEQPVGGIWCYLNNGEELTELQAMAQEIKKQVENGLARSLTRSRALIEERNRFGINLATNMGHDLTNIIASGKWDLDTIQRAQGLGIVELDASRGRFFEEAVQGLKNNLTFLQEMVEIYRSVGYLRRPNYEELEVTGVVLQVCDLFRRSISQNVQLQTRVLDQAVMTVEPRLLRMAIFNLLANAYQAIQRVDEQSHSGWIEVEMQKEEERFFVITVSDNGPGIRDEQGNLLQHPEIQRIFQSGYSTRKASSGGGLGLAWVKSIVEEFHEGSLHAVNRTQGGAQIMIQLPMSGRGS